MEEDSRCSILPLNIFMSESSLMFFLIFLDKPSSSYTSMKTPRGIIPEVVIQKTFHTANWLKILTQNLKS